MFSVDQFLIFAFLIALLLGLLQTF
jgi:hypothetical protein